MTCEKLNDEMKHDKVVVFIDILGFKNKVLSIKDSNYQSIYDELKLLQDQLIDKLKDCSIQTNSFSDSVIVSITNFKRLETDLFSEEYKSVALNFFNSAFIIRALTLIAMSQFDLIFEKDIFIRGGISLGKFYYEKGQNNNDIIISPALIEAYELESKKSVNPIISISKTLYDFLNNSVNNFVEAKCNPNSNLESMGNEDIDKNTLSDLLIFNDESKHYYLNYLNKCGYNEVILHKQKLLNAIKNPSNRCAISKYLWLVKYHNDFIQKMNLTNLV